MNLECEEMSNEKGNLKWLVACYCLDENNRTLFLSPPTPAWLSKSFLYCVQIFQLQSYQGERFV